MSSFPLILAAAVAVFAAPVQANVHNAGCISTGAEFEAKLQDADTVVLELCNNFHHFPTQNIDLSGKRKTVQCLGVCTIDGSEFKRTEDTAFSAHDMALLEFHGVTFQNFKTHDRAARVFYLGGPNVLSTFESCHFQDNGFSILGRAGGGAVKLAGSTANFNECTFSSNQAARGGVVQALSSSTVKFTNSAFHGNTGAFGGVIALSTGVDAQFINTKIEEGMARYGGVAMYFGPASLEFSGANIRGNRATEHGGVAYLSTNAGASIAFDKSTLSGNIAEHNGAVLYTSFGSKNTFTNTDVTRNLAGKEGGAIFAERDATIILADSNFLANNAFFSVVSEQEAVNGADGDHIYVKDREVNLVNCPTGGNTFKEPFVGVGVVFADGTYACRT